jgi:Fe-S cluster assembly protein SufD
MVLSAAVTENRFTEKFKQSISSAPDAWLKDRRGEAFAHFNETGFPGPKEEEWRYTNIAPIAKAEFGVGQPANPDSFPSAYPESAASRIVVLDGRIDREHSTYPALSFAGALADERFAGLVKKNLNEAVDLAKNGFTALNTAFIEEGVFIHIPKDTRGETPIHLNFVAACSNASFPRVFVYAEPGSETTLIETYESAGEGVSFTNAVVEIFLEENARLTHYRVQKQTAESFHIGTTGVVLRKDSFYDTTNINLGAALSRHDIGVKFTAEGGECFVDGLYMLNGSQHADTHSVIDHTVPNCTSHQTYKGVLSDRSHAVFNGKVFVRENAHGTDAQQSNKNLLLSNDARVDTKPQLEIFNDDVKCSHGATVGQLEEEELFYLLTRGLDPDLARNLLTYGFAEEVINKIGVESIKAELDEAVLHRLNTVLEA